MSILNSKLKIIIITLTIALISIIINKIVGNKSFILLEDNSFKIHVRNNECDDCDCCITAVCSGTGFPPIGNKWKCKRYGDRCECGCSLGCL